MKRFRWLLFLPMTARALDLMLPTANHALLAGDEPAFYQYTDRTFEGRTWAEWQGGRYGFTRTPVRTPAGVIKRQFHEGLDIKPLHRAPGGNPLDPVLAIAAGEVVHVNLGSGYSNYGRYIVVVHDWDGSRYFSLYAHLKSAAVKPGDRVLPGQPLGQMGYTGRGINQARAHLHFELGLLLNESFQKWYEANYPGEPNRHGIYSGLNLSGLDVATLYLALQKNPALTIPQFLAAQPVVFRVQVPKQPLDLLDRYPWLLEGDAPGSAWEISFTGSGLPVRITAVEKTIAEPVVSWARESQFPLRYLSRGYLTGSGSSASLTDSGRKLLALILQR